MATTGRQRTLRPAEASGYVTARAVSQAGIHTQELTRHVADGTLERVGRGKRGRRPPKVAYPRRRIVQFGGSACQTGIEVHEVGGERVSIRDVAKTIAGLCKARNRVGLDVAIETLREARSPVHDG